MRTIFLIAAVWLAIKFWPKIRAFFTLWRLKFTPVPLAPQTTEAGPGIEELLERGADSLASLGFQENFRCQSVEASGFESWNRPRHYHHPERPEVMAVLLTHVMPELAPYQVVLTTIMRPPEGYGGYVSGEGLVKFATIDAASFNPPDSTPTFAHFPGVVPATLLRLHEGRLTEALEEGFEPVCRDFDLASFNTFEMDRHWFDHAVEAGHFTHTDDENYLLSAHSARALVFNPPPVVLPEDLTEEDLHPAPDLEEEVDRHLAKLTITRNLGPTPGRTALFLITMLASILAFGLWFGWVPGFMVVVIILIHELGHFLAMRLFGYQGTGIYFVPFLGGLATGRKETSAPWQELAVLAAGPMPGILLGLGLLLGGVEDPLLVAYARMSVIINWLNLLPIFPLDGGRILRLLLFSRFPWAQAVFTVVSVAALAAGAFFLGDRVLGIFAVLFLLGLPFQFRQAKVLSRAASFRGASEPERVAAVVEQLRATEKVPVTLAQRHKSVVAVSRALREKGMGVLGIVLGLPVYITLVLGSLIGYAVAEYRQEVLNPPVPDAPNVERMLDAIGE